MTLTRHEIDDRIAILTRFRAALLRQRERFRQYLELLDAEEAGEGDAASLEIHVAMEHSIIAEIASFQRTIEPLEMLYRDADPEGAGEIPHLREALNRTRDEVLRRHEHNRALLAAQLEELRSQIASLRIVARAPSVYATPAPSLVDLHA